MLRLSGLQVCKFDLNQLGEEDDDCIFQNEYGYEDGQPCVLLKLNKVRAKHSARRNAACSRLTRVRSDAVCSRLSR